MPIVFDSAESVLAAVGKPLGVTPWLAITQQRVDTFADATDDHQWIHVDPVRAKAGPYGATIAHGYLSLSMVPTFLGEALVVEGMSFGVNYGCNKIRFPAPVIVDSKLRLGVAVGSVEDVQDGVQVVLVVSLEAEGSTKPCCVGEVVYRYFY